MRTIVFLLMPLLLFEEHENRERERTREGVVVGTLTKGYAKFLCFRPTQCCFFSPCCVESRFWLFGYEEQMTF